jgi:hypothetical protein
MTDDRPAIGIGQVLSDDHPLVKYGSWENTPKGERYAYDPHALDQFHDPTSPTGWPREWTPKLDLGPPRGWLMAIDPGPEVSGYVTLGPDNKIEAHGIRPTQDMLAVVEAWPGQLAIEMVASYGMPVGREVFETCVWIGRLYQAYRGEEAPMLVYRKDVKVHCCGTNTAKDGNVRQAMLDLFGPKGTKASPGPTYGFSKDQWAALALAATVRGMR